MRLKRGPVLAVLAAAAISAGLSLWAGPQIAHEVAGISHRLREAGPLGWMIFMMIEFVVTLVGIVPGALLGIVAGAIYGIATGFFASASGIMAGSMVAFSLSRSMLRPWIGRALGGHARLLKLDEAIARDGWRLVALLRVSPVMPFSITSYALGFSRIGWRDYVLGTSASLPPLLGYVVIGALGGMSLAAPSHGGQAVHLLLLGVGATATLALTWHLSRLVGRALRTA
jgi:uncharacterized membrane protein YdjX (TVP38/TMEM64 family)